MAIASDNSSARKVALRFVLLVGAMSFFADFGYEGARGILGPYLAVLGASGAAVGTVAGLGELAGSGFALYRGGWRTARGCTGPSRFSATWCR